MESAGSEIIFDKIADFASHYDCLNPHRDKTGLVGHNFVKLSPFGGTTRMDCSLLDSREQIFADNTRHSSLLSLILVCVCVCVWSSTLYVCVSVKETKGENSNLTHSKSSSGWRTLKQHAACRCTYACDACLRLRVSLAWQQACLTCHSRYQAVSATCRFRLPVSYLLAETA